MLERPNNVSTFSGQPQLGLCHYRGGSLRLRRLGQCLRHHPIEVHPLSRCSNLDGAEATYTDDWAAYNGIADENTRHETVNHSAKEYVRGDVHTNGIESVWSLLDRSIIGAFHQVSSKHLGAYVDELEFRFNNRENPYLFRDTIIRLLSVETLRCKELTDSSA